VRGTIQSTLKAALYGPHVWQVHIFYGIEELMEQQSAPKEHPPFLQRCKTLGLQVLAVFSRQTPAFAPPSRPENEDAVRLLPEISEDIITSTNTDMRNRDYYTRAGQKLATQQPTLGEHLESLLLRATDEPMVQDRVIEAALTIYDLLERQAQSDRMNQQL
jgi:hypothetical protein